MVLFNSKNSERKFYVIYYQEPVTGEDKFLFADTFEIACNRTESMIRQTSPETPLKVHIFEEVLTYIKHEKEKREDKKKRRSAKIKW